MKFLLLKLFLSLILISEIKVQDVPVVIKAKDLTLVFPYWKLNPNYFEIIQKTDSTFFYPELGETPEEMVFKIPEAIKVIKITQHYRTTLSISEEGPHLDLYYWKHYISPILQINHKAEYFSMLKYSKNQRSQFPDYTEKELADYLKNHSPQTLNWLYLNKFNTTLLYHSISEIYLTIFYIKPYSAKILKQVIVFHLPLGC